MRVKFPTNKKEHAIFVQSYSSKSLPAPFLFSNGRRIGHVELSKFFKEQKQERRAAVHVLAQGARDPKCNLSKLPTELLGKVASGFFYSTEEKLAAKIENLNNKQQETYCGFTPGFLSGKRF